MTLTPSQRQAVEKAVEEIVVVFHERGWWVGVSCPPSNPTGEIWGTIEGANKRAAELRTSIVSRVLAALEGADHE